LRNKLNDQYDKITGWSELYDTCDMETKKMIISRLMTTVRVKRDYELEIDLSVPCEQLGLTLDEIDSSDLQIAKEA